jgi:ubiquinone/menaquinone biosynthesis C-methylase UbiE
MSPPESGWQLEDTSAQLYERLLVPTVTRPWARDLVERARLRPGDRVLDVACGTGVVARLAVVDVGERGRVAGVDLNRGMLAVARSLPAPSGAAIEWHEGSADALPFGDGEFDVVLCQLGLQFFADRPAALLEMRRVCVAAGRCGASVFTSIDRNPAARALADAIDRHLGEGAAQAKRSEHALADPEELRELFETAGFVEIHLEAVSQTIRFASLNDWVEVQFAATPLSALLADRDLAERERVVGLVRTDVGEALAAFTGDGAFAFPQEVHVVLAEA